MNVEYCLAVCQKYEKNWQNYKKDGAFSSRHNALAELNMAHTFLFGFAEDIMCPSCRKRMVQKVFGWWETYKMNNQPQEKPQQQNNFKHNKHNGRR